MRANMRATVALEVRGKNASDIVASLLSEWRAFIGDAKSDLPVDADVTIVRDQQSTEYVATMHVRMRFEDVK